MPKDVAKSVCGTSLNPDKDLYMQCCYVQLNSCGPGSVVIDVSDGMRFVFSLQSAAMM